MPGTPTQSDRAAVGEQPRLDPFRVYTPGEVARLLGLNRRTIDRMVDRGDLPAARIGSARRIAGIWVLAALGKSSGAAWPDVFREFLAALALLQAGPVRPTALLAMRPVPASELPSPEEAERDAVNAVRRLRSAKRPQPRR